MIRDTFFSAPRFVNLCRKEMVESWKANLLRFVMYNGDCFRMERIFPV